MACPACRESAPEFQHPPRYECRRRRAFEAEGRIVCPSPPGLQRGDVDLMNSLQTEADEFLIVRKCEICCLYLNVVGMRLEG